MQQARIDIGEIRASKKTVNGFLRAPCYATRAGIFLYRNTDGTVRRELRHPDEVFNPASLETLVSVPVTDEHPSSLVCPKTASQYSKGVTGEQVVREQDFVRCSLTVFDSSLISTLENRLKSEVSCGYTCDVDMTPGTWNGEHYDAVQRNIRYNHLAVVQKGRAGPLVRVRIDGEDCAIQVQPDEGNNPMSKVRIDDVEFEVSEPVALAISQKTKLDSERVDSLKVKLDAMTSELESLKGQLTAKDLEIQSLSQKPRMDAEQIHTLVQERLSLLEKSKPFLDKNVKLDSMTDKEIKSAVIASRLPEFKADAHSDAFIDGLFSGLTQASVKTDSLAQVVNDTRAVGSVSSIDARKKAMDEARNAWKMK